MIFRKVIVTLLTIFLVISAIGQTITIPNVNAGTYGGGSGISVQLKLNGCFSVGNNFELYLSDASGSFSSPTKIGTYYGFFTPFVNGIIPAGTPAGSGYKLRVVSTNPVSSADYGPISISASSSSALPNPTSTPTNTIYDTTFGRCLLTSSQNLVLQETVAAGNVLTATVYDSTGATLAATVTTNQVQFTMVPGNYYSVNIQTTNIAQNTITAKSFLVLASTNNLSLQTSGANDVCLPAVKTYTVNISGNGGIKNNYPGSKYTIDWGDGTIDTYTQCEILARNGELLHTYKTTSCGRPPITDISPTQYNAFRVGVSANNPFCSSGFTALTTYAKAWARPTADFIEPTFGCANTPIIFKNISEAGTAAYNNAVNCTDNAIYEWYVDGTLVFNAPKDLVYTFTTLGRHTIRLVALNDPCSDEITKDIIVQDGYGFNFTGNGQDSVKGCTPLLVNLQNLTRPPTGMNWSDVKWHWQVLKRNSVTLADAGIDYQFVSGDTSSPNPAIKFLKPGKYFIRLYVDSAACGDRRDMAVYVADSASITLPITNKRYCDVKTIDFATDVNHKPNYNSAFGAEAYSWSVTGGSYSYVDSTTSTSAYPKIKFNDYAPYTVAVTFNNGCNTQTMPTQISFDRPITAVVSNDTTLCGSSATMQFSGVAAGPYSSFGWTIVKGTGTLSDPNISKPVYTFGAGDTTVVTLRFTVNPVAGSVCTPIVRDVNVTINPVNKITSKDTVYICTGTNVNYIPTSNISGSNFSWTSSVVTGSVTGNTANGSGVINDVLVNMSTAFSAIVKYTIVPLKNGCNGQPFDAIVIVSPKPDLNIAPTTDSICTGVNSNIKLTSSYSGAYYSWTAFGSSPYVTGYSNQDTAIVTGTISQKLINTGSQFETVTYTIRAYGDKGTCAGQTKTVTLVVKPGATVANAGADQSVCNRTSITLTGNMPVVGTGTWLQVAGPATTIVSPTANTTVVNGLVADTSFKFVWKITGSGSCPATTDTVVINNRVQPTSVNGGVDKVVCAFTGSDSVMLGASLAHTYEVGTWKLLLPKPAGSNPVIKDSSKANSKFYFNKAGTYKLLWSVTNDGGCSAATDTVLVNVYDVPYADSITVSAKNICKGDNVTITSGANLGAIKKWQYNPAPFNDNVWVDTLTNANFININNVQDSIKVRVIVQSLGALSGCSLTDTSNEVIVNVTATAKGGKTSQSDSVCNGSNAGHITLTGNVGNVVRWESSINNGSNWVKVKDSTTYYDYLNLTKTTWFRAVVQTGSCAPVYSDTTIITVMNPVTDALVGNDKTICNNQTTLDANSPGLNERGKWTQITGPNIATLSSGTDPVVTATGLIGGTYKFEWQLSNGGCTPTKDTITINVNPAVTQANAGTDFVICDFGSIGSVNLNATPITKSYEKGQWTIISKPAGSSFTFSNPADPAANFSFTSAGTYQLIWQITNDGGCSVTYDTINIRAYDKPLAGVVSGITNACVGSNVTLTMGAYKGAIKKWQYNPAPINDGVWIDTLITSPSIKFNSIQDTIAVRAIVESVGVPDNCTSTDTSNTVVIKALPPTIPGTTGPNNTVCMGTNSGTIQLSGHLGSIIGWEYSENNGGNWFAINDTSSVITYKDLTISTWFRAVVQSGSCGRMPSGKTVIIVLDSVTQANAGADQKLCNATQAILSGNNPAAGEDVLWTQLSGNAATLSANNVANVTVTNLKPSAYSFLYTISNGGCPPKNDTINIKIDSAVTNVIDTLSRNICYGQSVTIGGYIPTGGNGNYVYQWQQSTDGVTWTDIKGLTKQSLTIVPAASMYVRRVVTSIPCADISMKVYINVQTPLTNNNIVARDQQICIGTPAAALVGSVPAGANGVFTYQWQQSTDGGTTWYDIVGANNVDYTPTNVTVSTKYRRNVSSQQCTGLQSSNSNVVDLMVYPNAIASFTAVKDVDCPPFTIDTTVIKTASFDDGFSTYKWFANGTLIGTGETFPGYTMNKSSDSVLIKLVAKSVYGCKDDSVQHMFYTKLKPTPVFTVSDSVGCGPLLVDFTNNTANQQLFTYKWNFGNGQTSTAATPGSIIFKANPNYGDTTYKVSLTVYSQCDSVVVYKNILVHSRVRAVFNPDKTYACSPFLVTFTNNSLGAIDFTWNFGDGTVVNTTTTQSMQHTFISAKQDTFNVRLIARSTCGIDTQQHSIIITPNQVKLFVTLDGTGKFGCNPHDVKFYSNTIGAISTRWDFGDGNFFTTTNSYDTVLHTYIKPGSYVVKVTASNNCSDTTAYDTVKVFAKPIVSFTPAPITTCVGDSIHFNNLTDTLTSALWNFGDGTTSNLTNATHKYAQPGKYIVSLQAIRQYATGNFCVDSASTTATVVAGLPGNFTVSDSVSTCVPFTVTFKNLIKPSALTTWDFGDGTKDTGDVVTHKYITTGKFVASMTALSAGGCKYDATKNIVVNGPSGTWQYDGNVTCGSSPVRFEVTATGVDSFKYVFGDGTSLLTANRVVYHTYKQPGKFMPSLELISGSTAICRSLLPGVDSIQVEQVKAGFSTSMVKECGQTKVIFTDSSKAYFGMQSYSWAFGDGGIDSIASPQHYYNTSNNYPVRLIVNSKAGCADTATGIISVRVNNTPIVSIISDTVACEGATVSYSSDIISADPISFTHWSFSNGATSDKASFDNRYYKPGIQTATLVVSTLNGCSDTTKKTVLINPAPIVRTIEDKTICRGQSVQLDVTGAATYQWSPATNLSCATCNKPVASPLFSTLYVVSAVNPYGCVGKDSVRITVSQPVKLSVTPYDTVCKGSAAQLTASGAEMYKWSPAATLNNATVADPIAMANVSTKYMVVGYDSAGCFTDTGYVSLAVGQIPTVDLGPDKVLSAGTQFPLASTITNGPILNWDWRPYTDLSCNNCAQPIANIKKDITYSIKVTNAYGCSATDTIHIKVFCESTQVYIPNVFTPDGDGINDVLMVRGKGINTIKTFRIFTRWGELVFEKSNFTPNERSGAWDGTIRGVKAPPDVYVYTCEVLCDNNDSYIYKGNVAIIK